MGRVDVYVICVALALAVLADAALQGARLGQSVRRFLSRLRPPGKRN